MQSQLLGTQLNPPLEASLLLTLEKEGCSSTEAEKFNTKTTNFLRRLMILQTTNVQQQLSRLKICNLIERQEHLIVASEGKLRSTGSMKINALLISSFNTQPVINTRALNKEYKRHKYLMNQIAKNSYRHFQNQYFYESLKTLVSISNFDEQSRLSSNPMRNTHIGFHNISEVESTLQTNSPNQDSGNYSINADTVESYHNRDINKYRQLHNNGKRPRNRLAKRFKNENINQGKQAESKTDGSKVLQKMLKQRPFSAVGNRDKLKIGQEQNAIEFKAEDHLKSDENLESINISNNNEDKITGQKTIDENENKLIESIKKQHELKYKNK